MADLEGVPWPPLAALPARLIGRSAICGLCSLRGRQWRIVASWAQRQTRRRVRRLARSILGIPGAVPRAAAAEEGEEVRSSTGAPERPAATGARDRSSSPDAQMGSQQDPGVLTQPPAACNTHTHTHTCSGRRVSGVKTRGGGSAREPA